MTFNSQLLVAVIAVLTSVVVSSEAPHKLHHVTAENGKSITLSCQQPDRPPQSLTSVQWFDLVFNEDVNPKRIFTSDNNPEFQIEDDHPNHDDYQVDNNFRLTISEIDINEDSGEYFCRSVSQTGVTHERHYYISVSGTATCEGESRAESDTEVTLKCQLSYAGSTPTVNWFADKEPLDSVDHSDVGQAEKTVRFTATPDDDQKPYRCVASLGDVVEECSIVMNVPHSVRAIHITPTKKTFQVGDELKCSARGNPSPQITFSPSVPEAERSGVAWKTMKIPADWENEQKTVECVAVNNVDGKTARVSTGITFNVTGIPINAGATGGSACRQRAVLRDVVFVAGLASVLAAVSALFQ